MVQRIPQPSYAVRAVLLLGAALVAVWFAIGLRDARLQTQAIAELVSPHPRPQRVLSLLDDAGTLNASSQPVLLTAGLFYLVGNHARAIATLRTELHDHPQNIAAWGLLARYLPSGSAGAKRAQHQVAVLNGLNVRN